VFKYIVEVFDVSDDKCDISSRLTL